MQLLKRKRKVIHKKINPRNADLFFYETVNYLLNLK
jgi:hypothetical protein